MADSKDDLAAIDTALSNAVEDFSNVYTDQSTSAEQVIDAAETFESAAAQAQSDFARVADKGGDVGSFATKLAGEAGDMATAARGIADAFEAQDSAKLSESEDALTSAFDAYSQTADEYNEYLKTAGDPTYVVWLIVLIVAIVLFVLALLFALLTRKQSGLLPPKTDKKGKVTQQSLARLRWLVVLWAGVFVIGAAIPFLQVVFAKPDASGEYTYRIFWYPLAAGVILTIVTVVQYFIAAAKVRSEGSAEPLVGGGAAPQVPTYAPEAAYAPPAAEAYPGAPQPGVAAAPPTYASPEASPAPPAYVPPTEAPNVAAPTIEPPTASAPATDAPASEAPPADR